MNNTNAMDTDVAENFLGKLLFATMQGTANKTFIGQLEPLVSAITGDESALARLAAKETNSMIPYAGSRSLINDAVVDGVQDVRRDFQGYLGRNFGWMKKAMGGDDRQVDIYTGEPVDANGPFYNALQSVMPFGQQAGGTEEWRQWLIWSGWDGLQDVRTNPDGTEVTPEQRRWMSQHIAERGQLVKDVERISKNKEYNRQLRDWKKQIQSDNVLLYGGVTENTTGGSSSPRNLGVYKALDRVHRNHINAAKQAYLNRNPDFREAQVKQGRAKQNMRRGDVTKSMENTRRAKEIIDQRKI